MREAETHQWPFRRFKAMLNLLTFSELLLLLERIYYELTVAKTPEVDITFSQCYALRWSAPLKDATRMTEMWLDTK